MLVMLVMLVLVLLVMLVMLVMLLPQPLLVMLVMLVMLLPQPLPLTPPPQGLTISHCKAVGVEAGNTLEQPGGGPAQGPGLVHNVHVDGCTISGIGGTGIDIRGVGSGVKNSVIHDIGCRGAVVHGGNATQVRMLNCCSYFCSCCWPCCCSCCCCCCCCCLLPPTVARADIVHGGNATQLLAGNMFATNNSIKDFAQYKRTYMSGIHWAGVNNTYSHNTITDAPHNCMLGGGNEGDGVDCVFEFMRFERCGYESADTGAFYTCGQQASAFVNRGNILRHSTWNDIRTWESINSMHALDCLR